MPSSVIDIEKQALGLTPEQRAHLADKLLSSLSPDPAVEEAWSAEALRRLEELENGSVTAVPVEDAIARAQRHWMIVSTHPLAEEELTSGAMFYANRVNPHLVKNSSQSSRARLHCCVNIPKLDRLGAAH